MATLEVKEEVVIVDPQSGDSMTEGQLSPALLAALVPPRSALGTLLSSRSSAKAKAETLSKISALRTQTDMEAYRLVLDSFLVEVDKIKKNSLAMKTLSLPLPSYRLKLGSLARLMDYTLSGTSSEEDEQQQRRTALAILLKQLNTTRGVRALERDVLERQQQSLGMAEMMSFTPDLETPEFAVVAEGGRAPNGWQVRKYEEFTVVSTPMAAGGGAGAFQALAKYIFGTNQRSEAMKMTTPVISSPGSKMSFVMPSQFWRHIDEAPEPVTESVGFRPLPLAPPFLHPAVYSFLCEHSNTPSAP